MSEPARLGSRAWRELAALSCTCVLAACGTSGVDAPWEPADDDALASDDATVTGDDDATSSEGDTQADGDGGSGDPAGDNDSQRPSPLVVTLSQAGVLVVVTGDALIVTASASGGAPPYTFAVAANASTVGTGSSFDVGTLAAGDVTLTFLATDSVGEHGEVNAVAHVLPRAFDWSHRLRPAAPPVAGDWMTPVKNQLTCGSCWAYSAVAVMEARYNIQLGDPNADVDLSEQELIDCWTGAVGCGGGAPEQALDGYARSTGVPTEACRPTLGRNDTCFAACADTTAPARWKISGFRWGPSSLTSSRAAVQSWIRDELVHHGPIPRAFVGMLDWDAATKTCLGGRGDHFVVVVGYDHDAGTWLLRNSWGATWNGNGYFETVYGQCAVDAAASAIDEVIPPN